MLKILTQIHIFFYAYNVCAMPCTTYIVNLQTSQLVESKDSTLNYTTYLYMDSCVMATTHTSLKDDGRQFALPREKRKPVMYTFTILLNYTFLRN